MSAQPSTTATMSFIPAPGSSVAAHSCRRCLVQGVCLAAGLEPGQLVGLESIKGSVRVLQRGDALFRAGATFGSLYIVRSGSFKVAVTSTDGTEQVTGFYLPGEIMGLDGIETGDHRTTAVALETSSACVLPFHRLNGHSTDLTELQKQVWRLSSREVMNRQELLLIIARKDAEARLAAFLLSLSARLERIGFSPVEFRLSMGRQDIGDYLGLTVETVSRLFTRFQNRRLIECNRRLINLLDVDGLAAMSGTAIARHRKWITGGSGKPMQNLPQSAAAGHVH